VRGIVLALATSVGILHPHIPASSTAVSPHVQTANPTTTTSVMVDKPHDVSVRLSLETPVSVSPTLTPFVQQTGQRFGKGAQISAPRQAMDVTAGSPMSLLPPASRAGFTCIMWIESRSTPTDLHPTDLNTSSYAGGIFQFLPWIWQYAAGQLGISATYANEATISEQFQVAGWYYTRNGGFSPEWTGDNC
jgi:hypothetical protein